MKRKIQKLVLCSAALAVMIPGSALAIDFSEVSLYSDPLIDGVQFYAGDSGSWHDTYVDNLGNPYLMNGYDDGTGNSPGLYDSFIGADAQGFLFESVTLDFAMDSFLPGDTTLNLTALSGGIEVGSTSSSVSQGNFFDWHTLTITVATGFDQLYIWDDLENGYGEAFVIDNFVFTEYIDTGGGSAPVPEPATVLLFGTGLAGLAGLRRKTNNKGGK